MFFTEYKEFTFDPAVFHKRDTQIALAIHDEYVRKHSPNPTPRWFEIDRSPENIDPLWHTGKDNSRSKFTPRSPLDIPAINQFQKPDWRLTKVGIVPQRRDIFWVSHLGLKKINYFPMRGDLVFWIGYRYQIINVIIPPDAYWHQTGVWLGISVECAVIPDGDARPIADASVAAPVEISDSKPVKPLAEAIL